MIKGHILWLCPLTSDYTSHNMQVVVALPFVPLWTQHICEMSPSDSGACQTLNLNRCFAAFCCFLQNSPFSSLLCSSTPSRSLWIPILCACFSMDSSPFLRVWQIHHHFLIVIGNIIGFSPIVSHSSLLLFILRHLIPIILYKHRLMNISNLFIWAVTFQVLHPTAVPI